MGANKDLYYAAKGGNLVNAENAIRKGADVDWKLDSFFSMNMTPLCAASENGHLDMVKFLLDNGANPNVTDDVGKTPLHYATRSRHIHVMKELIGRGVDMNAKTSAYGYAPLYVAAKLGYDEGVQLLLDSNAEAGTTATSGKTPYEAAVKANNVTTADILRLHVPRPRPPVVPQTAPFKSTDELLLEASTKGNVDAVKTLLERGANIEARDNSGETPLALGSKNGHVELVKVLLARGANIEACDEHNGWTPLIIASFKGHVNTVKVLLDHGAQVDASSKNGLTPLRASTEQGHVEVTKILQHRIDALKGHSVKMREPAQTERDKHRDDETTQSAPINLPPTNAPPLPTFHSSQSVDSNTCLPTSPRPIASPFGQDLFLKLSLNASTIGLLGQHDLVLKLLALQADVNQLALHCADPRVIQVLSVLTSSPPLPQDSINAFFPANTFATIATHPDTASFVQDHQFLMNILAMQQNPISVNMFMADPRMGTVLTVLFGGQGSPLQVAVEPEVAPQSQTPDITTLNQLVAQLRLDPTKRWPLLGNYEITGMVIGESNHSIFKAYNTKRPSEDVVVKLTHQARELDFFTWMHHKLTKRDVDKLNQHIVKCEEWGEVTLFNYQCSALVLERGLENCNERLRFLQDNQYPRLRCLEEILEAVMALHAVQCVHCDIKLENVVFFGDKAGYKLVDFDNTKPIRTEMTKNCTELYCPPEMAHFMLGHTPSLRASTQYDVWCTAVLALKLFSRGSGGLDEFADVEDGKVLDKIASPGFSFEASVRATSLSEDRKQRLLKCLHTDPAQRGTMQDLVCLLPDGSTKRSNMTVMYAQVQQMNSQLEGLTVQVRSTHALAVETLSMTKATFDKVVETKTDLMRGIFDATEVHVPTSFILLPFNIQKNRAMQTQTEKQQVVEKATGFFKRLKAVGTDIYAAIQESNPLAAAKAALDGFTQGDTMYFYLLDDVTGAPVEVDTVYPIEITTTSDKYAQFMATNMALFQRGFMLLKVANKAAGLLASIGVPSLSQDTIAGFENLLDVPVSSAADFDVVQNALDDKTSPDQQVKGARGPALRELERFFSQHDADRTFAGLSRVHLATGHAVWTRTDPTALNDLEG